MCCNRPSQHDAASQCRLLRGMRKGKTRNAVTGSRRFEWGIKRRTMQERGDGMNDFRAKAQLAKDESHIIRRRDGEEYLHVMGGRGGRGHAAGTNCTLGKVVTAWIQNLGDLWCLCERRGLFYEAATMAGCCFR